MQTISTNEWTQITGLDASKIYLLQAQYKDHNIGGVFGSNVTPVMWKQQAEAPEANEDGELSDTLKASGSVNIYVKSQALPVNIIKQEVI